MGTRRSRHNKGRKPLYKEHRQGTSADALNAAAVERRGANELPQEKRQKIADLSANGKSLRDIAREVGCSKVTANNYVNSFRAGFTYGEPAPTRRIKDPYHRAPTNNVINAGFNYLSDLVVRPGIQKKLWPVLLYRGSMTPGQAHRMWNMVLLMMASECETLADGLKVVNNPVFSQLCGPIRKPQKYSLKTFLGRLHDNPDTSDLVPGVREYVRMLGLGPSGLTPVELETTRAHCAPWRISLHAEPGKEIIPRGAPVLFYPYAAHNATRPDEGRDLVMAVNAAVPLTLPEQWRADVCQEMIVAVLSGEVSKDDLHDHVRRYMTAQFKANPVLYEGGGFKLSLDAPAGDPDGHGTRYDAITAETYDHWEPPELSEEAAYEEAWEEADRNIARQEYIDEKRQEDQWAGGAYKTFAHPTQERDVYEKQIRDKQAEMQMKGRVMYRDEVVRMLEEGSE